MDYSYEQPGYGGVAGSYGHCGHHGHHGYQMGHCCSPVGYGVRNNFVLIVVLFILLIIVGSVYVR